MPRIELMMKINAPARRCFDLARSIDFHSYTMKHTGEKAIGGRTSGLIGLNETVTWEGKHFAIKQKLSSRITEFEMGKSFTDEMIHGPFKIIKHVHSFKEHGDSSSMLDDFYYEVPFGIAGIIFDRLFLHRYMRKLLSQRNETLRATAESEEWRKYI